MMRPLLPASFPAFAAIGAGSKVGAHFHIGFDPAPRVLHNFGDAFFAVHFESTSAGAFSHFNFADNNARARCRRERTVPMG